MIKTNKFVIIFLLSFIRATNYKSRIQKGKSTIKDNSDQIHVNDKGN